MTTSPDTLSTTLPADAHCPRCGYKLAFAEQTPCPECGADTQRPPAKKTAIRDGAGRQLLIGLGINAVVLVTVAIICLRLDDSGNTTPALVAVILPGISLLLGFVVSRSVESGDPLLWLDAWARSHLLLFVHCIMLPITLSEKPLISADAVVPIWICMVLGLPFVAGILFLLLCKRRELDSQSAVSSFMKLLLVIAVGSALLAGGTVAWTTWKQLSTIAC